MTRPRRRNYRPLATVARGEGREVVAGCCRWVEEPPMCSACSNWMTETRGIGEEE